MAFEILVCLNAIGSQSDTIANEERVRTRVDELIFDCVALLFSEDCGGEMR